MLPCLNGINPVEEKTDGKERREKGEKGEREKGETKQRELDRGA